MGSSLHYLPSLPDTQAIRSLRARYPIGTCLRIAGPPPPPPPQTTTTTDGSIPNLMERLERLAYRQETSSPDAAPFNLYTVEPTEAGSIYRATSGYLRWFASFYGVSIDQVPTPRSSTALADGEPAPVKARPRNRRTTSPP
jgi:hypothetical protein